MYICMDTVEHSFSYYLYRINIRCAIIRVQFRLIRMKNETAQPAVQEGYSSDTTSSDTPSTPPPRSLADNRRFLLAPK
jgi:hypothetical protein